VVETERQIITKFFCKKCSYSTKDPRDLMSETIQNVTKYFCPLCMGAIFMADENYKKG